MWLLAANFFIWESFVLTAEVMRFMRFLKTSSKTNVILCSALFFEKSLYEWKRVIPLKGRALGVGFPVYFRLAGNVLLQKVQSQHD